MNDQATFDLDHQIQSWRENLAQSPAMRIENLNELEAHLRDSVATLQAKGLSAEESFMVATKRLGTGGLLAAEFGKLNSQEVWTDRLLWMLVGLQVWHLVNNFTSSFTRSASLLAVQSWGDQNVILVTAVFSILQLAALAGSLYICWWLLVRKSAVFAPWFRRLSQQKLPLLTTLGIFAVIFTGLILPGLFNVLPYRLIGIPNLNKAIPSQAYSSIVLGICQPAIILALTVILARKRFKLS